MESETGLVKSSHGEVALERVRLLGRFLLDGLFPPVCLVCNTAVGTPDGLCPKCWAGLAPISAPLCPILGLPFETDMGHGAVSPKAIGSAAF